MITLLIKILKAMNSEESPWLISLGVWFALFLGFCPFTPIQSLVLLFLVCIVKVNIGVFVIFWGIFSGFALLLDPLFHAIGMNVLQQPSLQDLWTQLYNSPLGRLSQFNNSIVMGSMVAAVALLLPVLILGPLLVKYYRSKILPWLEKTPLMSALRVSKFYSLYREA